MSEYYEIDGENLKREFKACPEEGDGYWMGEHSDRYVCGHCGHTIWKDKKKNKK